MKSIDECIKFLLDLDNEFELREDERRIIDDTIEYLAQYGDLQES